MYSLRFCVRVMSPERHHWKPAVQAAAVMLRTPAVTCWSLTSNARTPRVNWGSRYIAIATGSPIANPPNSTQLLGAASTTPPSYIRVRAVLWAYGRGQTHTHTHTDTQTRVTTIHFATSTTHAKCKYLYTDVKL